MFRLRPGLRPDGESVRLAGKLSSASSSRGNLEDRGASERWVRLGKDRLECLAVNAGDEREEDIVTSIAESKRGYERVLTK